MSVGVGGFKASRPFRLAGDFEAPDRMRGRLSTGASILPHIDWKLISVGTDIETIDDETGESRHDASWIPFQLIIDFVQDDIGEIRDLSVVRVEVVDGVEAYVVTGVQSASSFRQRT